MATSIYLVPTPEDGIFSFRSRTLLHRLLGIHDRFENCIAYAPHGKYAPHCSRNINRANMQRRPGLLAELLQANIPSRQAWTLLREVSHCVVCGITGWHQPESEKIFKAWCKKLWQNYLRAHGLDPDLCLSSPDNMSRRSWRVGLLNARIEHDAQLALLAGSSASDSETESQDDADVSPDNDDDAGGDDATDDDDDGGSDDGSDDGDNADDHASDGTDSDLVILTPRSNTPNSEHGDDLASTASSRTLDHSPSHYQNNSAHSSRVNSDHNSPAPSSTSSTIDRTSQQAGPSVVSVGQSSKCAIQKSSTRLQVYRDPLQPPQPPKQKHQASAGTSGATTSLTTKTRHALSTLDRNFDTTSQDRASKPQPGPSRPRWGTQARESGPVEQSGPTATQQKERGDGKAILSIQGKTVQQRVIKSFEGVGSYDNTIRQQKRRPCSRCRGCGYRIVDDEPLATEEDILQMLSLFDVTEEQQKEEDPSSSPTKKGFRIYNPQLTPTENMNSILNTILQHSGPRNRAPGYIYAFTRPSLPGFLKIGYTNAVHNPDRPYPDPVDFRLARWASDCGHPVVEAFRAYMPCAAERMESLIHQTLREYRRVEDPGCRPCQRRRQGKGSGGGGGAHDEWFEVDVEVAQRVVSSWALFSAQRPYDSFGRPIGFWARKVERERRRAREVLDVGEWLERIPRYIEEMMRLDFRSIIGSTKGLIS